MRAMDELDAKVILALANAGMNIAETARKLFTHRNTVVYRVNKIARVTKLDPLNFYELHELVKMVKRVDFDGR